jgi:hypothetical protein
MLTETGKDLNIIIITEIGQDWQAFSTWYSIYKNIPDANVAITCLRNQTTPVQCFQWCKRLNIPVSYTKLNDRLSLIPSDLLGETVLVLPSLTMVVDVLDKKVIDEVNSKETFFWSDGDILMFKGLNKDTICECPVPIELIKDAKHESLCSLVDCRKGCGKWIPTLRGCPLSNAEGLISEDMTMNENRVIALWKQMVALYSAVAY